MSTKKSGTYAAQLIEKHAIRKKKFAALEKERADLMSQFYLQSEQYKRLDKEREASKKKMQEFKKNKKALTEKIRAGEKITDAATA